MTQNTQLHVLVTGATGLQGGALARVLLERGHKVRAFTRNPDSLAAKELGGRGAEVVGGSFLDPASVRRAARGVDTVFAVTTPFESGTEAEILQGIVMADAAKMEKVHHLVYTSVASAPLNTGIAHFESKYWIEQYIRRLGVPFTIIAPVYFMENILRPWSLPALQEGRLAIGLPSSRSLQQVAVRDIAHFTALVLEYPEKFLGMRVEIASDEISGVQAAEILSYVSGLKIEYQEIPISQDIPLSRVPFMSEEYATMLGWMDRVGYSADIASLRNRYPEVGWHGYEQWARTLDWSALGEGKKAA